ncbi:MAG TPA: ABC transporter ATP-binding protein [Chloroflexia bacterium]|nr:ABC transporter ATP-binding protein [Chloroflexia bacterium]
MPEPIVVTENLTKRYGAFTALANLNLTIERGAIHGFIGPNGAGKTTTMRILATLLEQTEGQAWVADYPVSEAPMEVRKRIGYMPDFFGVYDNMKVWEYLDFFASAYHVPNDKRTSMINDLLSLVDLSAKHDSFVEELSRGMKQRLCLARTLVHNPDLLILDEPASGLDPHARIELRELLKELRSLGKTILVSSHILTELAEMCTHIAIIERGRLLVSGSVADILKAMQPARELYVRVLSRSGDALGIVRGFPTVLSSMILPADFKHGQAPPEQFPGATPSASVAPIVPIVPTPVRPRGSDDGGGFSIPPPPGAFGPAVVPPPNDAPATLYVRVDGDNLVLGAILARLVSAGIPVYGYEEAVDDLEEIFLRTTKGLVQ